MQRTQVATRAHIKYENQIVLSSKITKRIACKGKVNIRQKQDKTNYNKINHQKAP